MSNTEPHFITPRTAGDAKTFLQNDNEIRRLVTMKQSAVNVLFPEQIVHNYNHYKAIGDELAVTTEIYYSHKPNKSYALAHELACLPGSKIDVASIGEFRNALGAGFSGSRIEVTGPKSNKLLLLALHHQATINIDSLGELHSIVRLAKTLNITTQTPVFLRLADPTGNAPKDSRFGITQIDTDKAFDILAENTSIFFFRGFSYHLNSYTFESQRAALAATIQKTMTATERGLQPNAINIGGGLRVNYVDAAHQWRDYESAIKQGALGSGETMGWNESSLGWRSEKSVLAGGPRYMPFYQERDQYQQLKALLTTHDEHLGGTYAQLLRDLMITLCIEPGRSMLDMCGVTLASVQDVKRSIKGEQVIVLDMNRSQLDSFEQEYMLDPIVIPKQPRRTGKTTMSAFLAGNLCLASDFVSHRRVYFDSTIKIGDILAFPNTAGYFMDFAESATLQQQIAPKVAVTYLDNTLVMQDDRDYITTRIL